MIHTPPNQTPTPGPEYLRATTYFDNDNPALRAAAEQACAGAGSDVERAIKLFYWVRDGWRYDPFSLSITAQRHTASDVLARDHGYCVTKAILLSAAARVVGIPSAIGFSDVTNHLTSEKLMRWMGGKNVFYNHGYSLLYLDGRWVKAAPAFNIDLCDRFGVMPTEFDGRQDAIMQEFDRQQRHHMEYLTDHGYWSDFPFEKVEREFRAVYPVDEWERGIDDPYFAPDKKPV